jgi:hypothetical protein
MLPECEAAIEEALGRSLRKGEVEDLENNINLQMRLLGRKDPAAWLAMSQEQRYQTAANATAEAMKADLQKKQQRVRLQIEAHDRIENQLNTVFDQLPEDRQHFWQLWRQKPGTSELRSVSNLLAFDAKGRGIQSAETRSMSIARESLGQLLPLWQSVKGFAHLFEDSKGVADLVHELFGESTGNVAAKSAADAWRQVTDGLRERANAAGMDVGKLEDWHYPQNWSQARIASAGADVSGSLEKFTGDLLPLLNRDKYLNADGTRMSNDQVTGILHKVFDSIITDGRGDMEPGKAPVGGSLSNRMSQHRALYFKDADSYLTAQGLYGNRSLWPTLTGHIFSISRDIGLIEALGPNPEETFRYFNDRTWTDSLRQNAQNKTSIDSAAKFNTQLFDYVAGRRDTGNPKIAAAFQAFRNYETATKLGRVVITALGDEAGMAATAFANHVPYAEVLSRELTYLNPLNAEDRAIASHAGLGINGLIGGLNRFGQEDLAINGDAGMAGAMRDFSSKLATGVMNASGAEAMWDARRRALGSVLQSYLGKWTREVPNFSDLNEADHGILARKGITETDWQVWKRADLEDWGMKHGVLTTQAVRAIPDEKLADLGNPESLRRNAATSLLGHVLEETGMGVMDTGARERAGVFYSGKSGTVGGELLRSVMLFKSFGLSMMQKHWARAASLEGNAAVANYAARIIVGGTILGAVANQLRNITSGKDPSNVAEPQFWGESLLRGGGFGFYGDFLYSELTQHDTSLIPALAGPAATETEQLWNLTGGAAFKSARGERVDEGAKVVRFVRSNIPFLNMWYTQAAFDHLIWNQMQEAASPGYLDRMQARAYEQRGTSFWWDPQQSMPAQGPDFAKMWQPERGAEQIQKIREATGLDNNISLQ